MSDDRTSTFWTSLLNHGISFALSLAVTAIAAQILVRSFEGPQDVSGESSEKMLIAKREWSKKHGPNVPFPDLTAFEQTIMQDMIFPSQINASFEDIGGLDQTKRDLFETVLLPLTHPHLYQSMGSGATGIGGNGLFGSSSQSPISSLLSAPTGVLFYGPPGCGKTIMAKAIAHSADCTFIQCNFATLISKYYGESEKFIASLFSVARKFAPAVIFIDEVDMYLGKRGTSDREQESRMKAQFLSLWDGLTSNQGSVLVLGATNRPFDLDEAILRRFSKQIIFDLPSATERLHILSILLNNHVALDEGVLEYVSMKTNGFSGSDLKELAKRAAMEAVRERIHQIQEQQRKAAMALAASGAGMAPALSSSTPNVDMNQSSSNLGASSASIVYTQQQDQNNRPRPTTKADFDVALKEVQPTGQQSMEYLKRFYNQSGTMPTRFLQGSNSNNTSSNNPPSQGGSQSRPLPPLVGGVAQGKPIKRKGSSGSVMMPASVTAAQKKAAEERQQQVQEKQMQREAEVRSGDVDGVDAEDDEANYHEFQE